MFLLPWLTKLVWSQNLLTCFMYDLDRVLPRLYIGHKITKLVQKLTDLQPFQHFGVKNENLRKWTYLLHWISKMWSTPLVYNGSKWYLLRYVSACCQTMYWWLLLCKKIENRYFMVFHSFGKPWSHFLCDNNNDKSDQADYNYHHIFNAIRSLEIDDWLQLSW